MGLRVHIGEALIGLLGEHRTLELPEGAARHVQVMRLQPGDELNVFDGAGHEWLTRVTRMGKRDVAVEVVQAVTVDKELATRVTLAVGVPANDRMDTIVEKAAELGVYAIQPLMCERAVLRLSGERAAKKVAHWQAVAISACEQCGRAVVPVIEPVRSLESWVASMGEPSGETVGRRRAVLSLRETKWIGDWLVDAAPGAGSPQEWVFLSGPEGGLSHQEEQMAIQAGFQAISLGSRTLRADTAPIAIMSIVSTLRPPGAQSTD